MNNILFSLVRFLRDRGIDADLLLLDNEADHFLPLADTFDTAFEEFTTHLTWGKIQHFLFLNKKLLRKVASDLGEYDFIIGCGPVPAYLEAIGRKVDIFIPYGSDLLDLPFFKPLSGSRYKVHSLPYRYLLYKFQRSGIQNSKYIITDDQSDATEAALAEIQIHGERLNYGTPMVYTPLYNPSSIKQYYGHSPWYEEFKRIREKHDLVIFHHARHIWKGESHIASKGNDKLFRGFAEFAKRSQGVDPCIVTCEYGSDVRKSKELIRELGIEDRVYWFPLLPRKEIMIALDLCDIGCGEFDVGWITGGTIYEVLAMAKPLMHYRNDSFKPDIYPDLYSMINVKDSSDITAALFDYVDRPEYYKAMGERGLEWLHRYAVDEPLKVFTSIINADR